MKLIDSQALGLVTKALGLSGSGSQQTELADGVVDQALDMIPLIRRGNCLARTEGVFMFRIRNVHTDAESISTAFNPYILPATGLHAPFPSPIPSQFDLWLLHANVRQIAGGGTISATLGANFPAHMMAFSIHDGAGAVTPAVTSHMFAFWDALITEGVVFATLAGSEQPTAMLGIRLPRDRLTQLVFSTTSSLTTQFDLHLMVGLFPVALGQDGIV